MSDIAASSSTFPHVKSHLPTIILLAVDVAVSGKAGELGSQGDSAVAAAQAAAMPYAISRF